MTGIAACPLEVDGLEKRFGDVQALAGVGFALAADELLTLVGPSGCGKSTLLRTIAGLVDADAGTIRLGGELVDDGNAHVPPERRHIGLVFQEHALFPHLTVAQNVGFGVRDGGRSVVGDRVEEMLALVSLGGYGSRYPHELSGGERQRVALARALAPRPALMLFDEPFASLDHNLRIQLRHDVVRALKATATPAVFVTHDQHEALAIGDRIAVMRRGRIVQLDTPAAVFHRPVDTFVAAFMGEASFLTIAARDGMPATTLGPLDVAGDVDGAHATAMVRPDDVAFVDDEATVDADEGGPVAELVAAEYRGSGWLFTARLADGSTVLVESSHLGAPSVGAHGRLALVPGHRQVIVPVASP